MTDDIPRRCQLEHMTPAERAIYDAMGVVEAAGCDVQLTEAVNLLQKARDRVADFVDGVNSSSSYRVSVTTQETLDGIVADREHYRLRWAEAQRETSLAQKRIKSLEDGIVAENKRTSVIEQELQAVKDVLIARDEDFHPEGLVSVAVVVARILNERDRVRNEYEVSLSRVHEEASTATDVLCGALGKDHGRGGLVEHCLKAAEKIKKLEAAVEGLRDGERVTAICENLRADQRATGDVLAAILGRERCEDGNVRLANDVALKVEELQTACDSYHLGSCYAEEPCLDCAAAKRRRASRQAKDSGGSGAAQPATPEPAGEWAEIPRPANLGSGLEPHLPDCPGHTQAVFVYVVTGMCSVCSARVRVPRPRVANGPRDPAMILTLPQTPQPKLTDLVSRERLASAFLAASNAGNWRSAFAELARVLEE